MCRVFVDLPSFELKQTWCVTLIRTVSLAWPMMEGKGRFKVKFELYSVSEKNGCAIFEKRSPQF